MTIRYQCPECDSVLKIRDDKAGTDAKCPGCKSKFTVPQPEEVAAESDTAEETTPEKSAEKEKAEEKKPKKKSKQKAAAAAKKSADDDFDAAAFLMEDGPGAKASAGLVEEPKEQKGPATDSKGRRLLTPNSSSSAAKRASMSPAAAAADQQIDASANARDLLSKTMDESRVRASTMPVTEKKPLFDFSGARQELIRYAPHIGGFFVLLLVCYWIGSSMFGGGVELPELRRVSGTVTVNGAPLSGVTVVFQPLEAKSGSGDGPDQLRSATGNTNEQGYYELQYMQGVYGAPVGKGRIWLEAQGAAGFKKIPPGWGSPSQEIYEVREAGNDGNFDLTIQQ